MSSRDFSFTYDGPPVQEGSIDARDLAPSLLALADLVDEAAPLVHSEVARLSVRIKPTFEKGSFVVHFDIADLYSKFISLFGSPEAQAWSAFFQIVGLAGAMGVLQLIKKAKGRKPTSVSFEHTEKVTLTFEGELPEQYDKRVWELFENARARKAIEKLVSPVADKGFESFKIYTGKEEALSVTTEEAPFFKAPPDKNDRHVVEFETRLVIVAMSFNAGNKWRVWDGSKTLYVSLGDEAFNESVQKGIETFRKGDSLYVTLKITQWVENSTLNAEHTIVKVHRHEVPPKQSPLL